MAEQRLSTAQVLWLYTRQRCPLMVLVPVAAILFLVSLPASEVALAPVFLGGLSAILFLWWVRLSDDMADVAEDRNTHPERLLCSPQVSLAKLHRCRWFIAAIIVLLNAFSLLAVFLMAAVVLMSGAFFYFKSHLNWKIQTVLLNSTLAVFPLHGGLVLVGRIDWMHLGLGLFFWLGGLAHDYSHCLEDTSGRTQAQLLPIQQVNQRYLAACSLVLYSLAALVGLLLYAGGWVGWGFVGALCFTFTVILVLEVRLIRSPTKHFARPFYYWGFAFFLLPALGHLAQTLLGQF